jgi:hypothetical protein
MSRSNWPLTNWVEELTNWFNMSRVTLLVELNKNTQYPWTWWRQSQDQCFSIAIDKSSACQVSSDWVITGLRPEGSPLCWTWLALNNLLREYIPLVGGPMGLEVPSLQTFLRYI